MSRRTVIEINHDYIHDLQNDPEFAMKFFRKLSNMGAWDRPGRSAFDPYLPGVRKLGERHHSETLKLTIE